MLGPPAFAGAPHHGAMQRPGDALLPQQWADAQQFATGEPLPQLPQHLMRGPMFPSPDAGPSKKYKPPKKRVKGVPAETYRDRWLKKLPRKNMASWLSNICSACERIGSSREVLVPCAGPCLRSFHLSCVGCDARPADAPGDAPWFCPECDVGRMKCFVCGEYGACPMDLTMRKCSLGACGRFYHLACASALPLCNMGSGGSFFRCPQHYCATCGKSGDGVDMVKCLRCPVAYHAPGCMPRSVARVPGCHKGVLCPHCRATPRAPYCQPPDDEALEARYARQDAEQQAQYRAAQAAPAQPPPPPPPPPAAPLPLPWVAAGRPGPQIPPALLGHATPAQQAQMALLQQAAAAGESAAGLPPLLPEGSEEAWGQEDETYVDASLDAAGSGYEQAGAYYGGVPAGAEPKRRRTGDAAGYHATAAAAAPAPPMLAAGPLGSGAPGGGHPALAMLQQLMLQQPALAAALAAAPPDADAVAAAAAGFAPGPALTAAPQAAAPAAPGLAPAFAPRAPRSLPQASPATSGRGLGAGAAAAAAAAVPSADEMQEHAVSVWGAAVIPSLVESAPPRPPRAPLPAAGSAPRNGGAAAGGALGPPLGSADSSSAWPLGGGGARGGGAAAAPAAPAGPLHVLDLSGPRPRSSGGASAAAAPAPVLPPAPAPAPAPPSGGAAAAAAAGAAAAAALAEALAPGAGQESGSSDTAVFVLSFLSRLLNGDAGAAGAPPGL